MKNDAMVQTLFVSAMLIVISTMFLTTNALTTFGKTNPQTQNQPPPPPTPVGNARDCKMESDCSAIQNTTCMPDRPRDGNNGKTKCLCGDYSAPINGRCNNKGKAVYVLCNDDAECHEGSECVEKSKEGTGKRCLCKEKFYEDNFKCNSAETIFRSSSFALIVLAFLVPRMGSYST